MTTEMFGAPYGIQQAEQQINQNVLSGLKAQQLLGEIGQQPAEKAMKEAHARLYGADAAMKEQAARDAAELNDVAKEVQARRTLSAAAAAQGRLATIEDLSPAGSAQARSQAEPVEEFLAVARERGIPETKLVALAKEASTIRQHEAATANSAANAQVHQIKAQTERLGMISQIAGAAASSPLAWADTVADPEKMKLLPPGIGMLPFAQAQQHLRTIETAGIDTIKRLELDQKKITDDVKMKLERSQMGVNSKRMSVLEARGDILREDLKAAKKSGGKYSQEYADLKKAHAENEKSLAEQRNLKMAPPAPLDPEFRVADKVYTNAKGEKAIWRKFGNIAGWELYKGAALPPQREPASATADTSGEEED